MWNAAFSRIVFWALSGVLVTLGVPVDVQAQINEVIGGNPMIAAGAVVVGTAIWYWKDKLSKGDT